MKTILIFLITVLFCPLIGKAQVHSDILLQDGAKWEAGRLDFYVDLFQSRFTYEVKGDSIIEDKTYKKVYEDGKFYALLREDNQRNVYVRYRDQFSGDLAEKEIQIYTFGTWEAGQTIQYNGYWPGELVSRTIEENSLSTIQLKDGKEYIRYTDFDADIIRGIGDVYKGPLGALHPNPDNGTWWQLLNFYYQGKLLCINDRLQKNLQTYLAREGVHWTERSSVEEDPENPDPCRTDYKLMHYCIQGDTLLNGNVYKKVYCNNEYYTGLRVEDFFKIMRTSGDKEYLLYNFDWTQKSIAAVNEQGEEFYFPMDQMKGMTVYNERMEDYITYCIHANPNPEGDPFRTHNKDIRLIMNVGLTSGIFSHIIPRRDCYCFNDLVCFYEGDRLIYQNPVFTETGEVLGIDTPRKEGNLSVLVSGNEVVFTLRNLSGKQHTVLKVYTPEGMQVATYSLQNGTVIANDLPDGIYLYHLYKDKKKIETGKFCINK